jgi:amino acid adenylation domain-containing protein
MPSLLHEAVTAQASVRPDAIALTLGGETMTYGALEAASNSLANLLRDAGCQTGDRVCLFMPKSPLAVVGMLGVLKAGAAYVPLDTASPAQRIGMIIEASEPRAILLAAEGVKGLESLLRESGRAAPTVIAMQDTPLSGDHFASHDDLSALDRFAGTAPDVQLGSESMAHVLFTSGSTGTPKGVVITHRNALSFVDWGRGYFGMAPGEKISSHPPLHFDLSTFDIYGTLSAGAELHMVPKEANLLPAKMAEFIRTSALDQWFSVPSVLTFMAKHDVVAENDFPDLKRLLWCGEVLPTPTLIHWMERLPHVTFTNLYGPTEATIASSYYTVPACPTDPRAAVPIGIACDGENLLVLDDSLKEVQSGETGDLFIQGIGLSPGYWRDEEKTRAAFLPNPFSEDPTDRIYRTGDLARVNEQGLVEFLGRADTQIKSRGYRIELGEIEAALSALENLRESAVVAYETGEFEGAVICCGYVPADDITPAKLRRKLTEALPSYMIPSRWMAFEALPKNVNGKIDRKQIKADFEREAAKAA